MSIHVCGVPDKMLERAERQVCKWPGLKLTWCLTQHLPGMTSDEWWEACRLAFSFISDVCGLEFEYSTNPKTANIVTAVGVIDGRSGTLAFSGVQCGGKAQIEQKIDSGELKWVNAENPGKDELDVVRVMCHEDCHALGMPHIKDGNLLAPMYSPNIRRPQQGDIEELVLRYGLPRPKTVPTVPVTPTTPTSPAGGGGMFGNIAALVALFGQLAPLIKWATENKASLTSLLAVIKQLAEMFGGQLHVAKLSLGSDREQLVAILVGVGQLAQSWAAKTSNPYDDVLAGLFLESVKQPWLADFLGAILSGEIRLTPALVEEAAIQSLKV